MHEKTKLARPPQEGQLGFGEILELPYNYKNMDKIEKSEIRMFLRELITAVNLSCK